MSNFYVLVWTRLLTTSLETKKPVDSDVLEEFESYYDDFIDDVENFEFFTKYAAHQIEDMLLGYVTQTMFFCGSCDMRTYTLAIFLEFS